MIIDIAFILLMVVALYRGLGKGVIVGIFSLLAFIIGLAAALKLSALVAQYLKDNVTTATKWLPVISFILVFILVVFLVGLGARLIRKIMRFAMLGWLDRLLGMLLYMVIYTIIFSVFLFFTAKISLIKSETISGSILYPYVSPWGPKVIDNLGNIIPIFKNLFTQLQDFFGGLASKSS